MATAYTGRTDLTPLLYAEPLPLKAWYDVGGSALTLTGGSYTTPAFKFAGAASNNNTLTHEITAEYGVAPAKTTEDSADSGSETLQGKLTLKIPARLTGTPASAATLAASAYISTKQAGVSGSNLVTTASQNLLTAGANNWTVYSFEIDGETIAASDVLSIAVRAINNDTGGSGGGAVEIGTPTIEFYQHG